MKISKWFTFTIVILSIISWPGLLLARSDLSASRLDRPAMVSGLSARSAYVPDELLIRFKKGHEGKETEVAQKARGQVVERKQKSKLVRVKLPAGADLPRVLAMYRADPAVAYAEPNYIFTATTTPNDYYFSQQWALSPSKLGMEEAWTETVGSTSVIIAVIDSGVDANHPDLASKPGEAVKVISGYNAITGSVGQSIDDEGHGTMVAGVAAAVQGNAEGISGVAPGARLMPIKVLDSNGYGTLADVAEGITWAADNGAKILNLSLGSSDDSQALREAVIHAYARGTVIIAAAGNNRGDVSYPAALPEVIAVTATNENDLFWEGSGTNGSNRGSTVDLSAPGVNIHAPSFEDITVYDETLKQYIIIRRDYKYVTAGGTSLAAPHVAGVAALIASKYPGYTNDQIRTLLTSTAKDLGTAGWDMFFGFGRLDAAAALKSPFVPQAEPDNKASGALPVVLNGSIEGVLQRMKDVDWHRASFAAPGKLYVELDVPEGVDGVVEVYDQFNVLRGTIDNHGKGISDTGLVDIPAAGDYYLRIYDYNGSWSDQPYTLTIFDHPALEQGEDNNTYSQANPITTGQTINATLSPIGDEDWYSIIVGELGSLRLTVDPPPPIDPVLTILDKAGNQLRFVDPNGPGESEQVELTVAPGTYYIGVSDYNDPDSSNQDFSNRPYSLRAAFYLPPPGDLDGDMIVGIFDLRIAATAYGTRLAETGLASPDLNGDGIVDIFDLVRIGRNMGR